jgi:hypothetical protein
MTNEVTSKQNYPNNYQLSQTWVGIMVDLYSGRGYSLHGEGMGWKWQCSLKYYSVHILIMSLFWVRHYNKHFFNYGDQA